jgi:hypothetical protein
MLDKKGDGESCEGRALHKKLCTHQDELFGQNSSVSIHEVYLVFLIQRYYYSERMKKHKVLQHTMERLLSYL